MKEEFFQYNMKKSGAVDKIMNNGIIVLDTNALLNTYRFSKDNREKYFEILDAVRDRLFLTHHSVQEFYNNRLNIIYYKSNFKECLKETLVKEITSINNMLDNSNFKGDKKDSCNLIKHEENLKNNLIKILNDTKVKIEEQIDSYKIDINNSFINDDAILDKILETFDKKVNSEFTKDELNQIYKEGSERYKNDVPPGYKDKDKSIPDCYGDLVIWKELIKISKTEEKDILFVSDDRKLDWCEKFKEYDLGPRKELIKEFFEETNQKFHSITTKEFIKYISSLHTIEDTKDLERESEIIQKEISYSDALKIIKRINLDKKNSLLLKNKYLTERLAREHLLYLEKQRRAYNDEVLSGESTLEKLDRERRLYLEKQKKAYNDEMLSDESTLGKLDREHRLYLEKQRKAYNDEMLSDESTLEKLDRERRLYLEKQRRDCNDEVPSDESTLERLDRERRLYLEKQRRDYNHEMLLNESISNELDK